MTQALRDDLVADDLDPDELISAFQEWKASFPDGEFGDYWFGKDGAFVSPRARGRPYSLLHVHLVPLMDPEERERWDRDWKHRSRRTSDRILIYSENAAGDFLLIYILSEGGAHKVMAMQNDFDREVMEGFAEVAGIFREEGKIAA